MRACSAAILIVTLAVDLCSYTTGTPDGYAGEPPRHRTCAFCHFGGGEEDGSMEIQGVPDLYVPDSTYSIAVILADSGMRRWGFQLTVMDTLLRAGGTIAVTDPVYTYLNDNPGDDPDYLNQSALGTYSGQLHGPVSWTFDWTAPSGDVGPVTFYASGTPCDGRGTSYGDLSYEREVISQPGVGSGEEAVARGPADVTLEVTMGLEIEGIRISFSFGGGAPAEISFVLLDSSGREQARKDAGSVDAGAHVTDWVLEEDLPPGPYFLTLEVNGVREASKEVLLR
jgi:hypothetical protein